MQRVFYLRLWYFFLLLGFFLDWSVGYSKYFLEEEWCSVTLDTNVEIMGQKTIKSTESIENIFVIESNGQKIMNGSLYEEGGFYTITYLGKGQHVFEIKGARWSEKSDKNLRFVKDTFKHCEQRRSVSTIVELALPIGEDLPDIEIWCGYVAHYGKVMISDTFYLTSPSLPEE